MSSRDEMKKLCFNCEEDEKLKCRVCKQELPKIDMDKNGSMGYENLLCSTCDYATGWNSIQD